jgi:hypothetical protein
VGFLDSPLWAAPVGNFIDQNCVIFDSEEENKLEYTPVHNGYRGERASRDSPAQALLTHILAPIIRARGGTLGEFPGWYVSLLRAC